MDNSEYSATVKQCLAKWQSGDKRTAFFEEHFESWILQLPESVRHVIFELVKDFDYFTQQETNRLLKELHSELINKDNVNEDNTIFTYIHSETGVANSSVEYWIDYKRMNDLNKLNCFESLEKIPAIVWGSFENIVIIDDFCGSGKTISDFIKNNKELLKGKQIFYIVIYLMSESLTKIQQLQSEIDLSVIPISACVKEKLFDKEKWIADAENLRNQIIEVSKAKNINDDYALGHEKTESLVAFHNNTPNNTLGLFWCDREAYFSIFPRESSPKRLTLYTLQKEKSRRNAQNYNARRIGGPLSE